MEVSNDHARSTWIPHHRWWMTEVADRGSRVAPALLTRLKAAHERGEVAMFPIFKIMEGQCDGRSGVRGEKPRS